MFRGISSMETPEFPRIGKLSTYTPLPFSRLTPKKFTSLLHELKFSFTDVALPEEVIAPVKFASVVTFPAVNPEAVPVMFVPTNVGVVLQLGTAPTPPEIKTEPSATSVV